MEHDGCCSHGVPYGEACLLCERPIPSEEEETKESRRATTFKKDVKTLIRIMQNRNEWLTSEQVLSILIAQNDQIFGRSRFTRTHLRHLTQAAKGKVMSGQKGYKYTRHANPTEMQEASAAYLKGAKGYMKRRREMLHEFHRGVREKERTTDGREEERLPGEAQEGGGVHHHQSQCDPGQA